MKSLLLALAACAVLAGCAAYPVYPPASYGMPEAGVQPAGPGVYTAPPVYTYPYPYAYPSAYPYGSYGAPWWYPSLWISGSYWCCSGGHFHRGHHGGHRGGHGGHRGRR